MAEKGIRTVWIDSDSVGVLGTKVYRDDVLIATVPIGTQIYNDPTAIVGVEYKYEVQAYTSSSESTDETLGVNIDYYEIAEPVVNLMPIMTNFRVDDAVKNRILFDTPLGAVTGLSEVGFVVTGKGVQSVDDELNFITVDSDFNYWDNNSIKLSGGNGIVYDFTKEPITNNIVIAEGATSTFFVDGSVGSSGDGLTEGTAFKTLLEGFNAMPASNVGGGKLWVKAFDYGNQRIDMQTTYKNGTVTNPNVIEGYKTTPGDIDSMYYAYNINSTLDALDPAEMPLFDGGSRASTQNFIDFWDSSYWIVRNVQFTNYLRGMRGQTLTSIEIDNCLGLGFGELTSNNGLGLAFNPNENDSHKVRIKDTIIINATLDSYLISGDGFKVDNCEAYCNEAASVNDNDATTDYYYQFNGNNGLVLNSLCYKDTPNGDGHAGHGFAFKSDGGAFTVENNLVKGCEAVNIRGSYQARHISCRYNDFKDSIARANVPNRKSHADYCYSAAIELFSGGSYNTFENITAYDLDAGVIFLSNAEEDSTVNIQNNALIKNCTFDKMKWFIYGENATTGTSAPYDNVIDHCTVNDADYFSWITSRGGFAFGNNYMRSNIFNDVPLKDREVSSDGWAYNYCLYWDSWTIGTRANAINVDPDLIVADYTADDYMTPQAIFSEIDVPRKDGIYYDKNGNERQDPTTVGGVMSPSEVAVEPGLEIPTGITLREVGQPVETYDFYVSATGTGDGLTSDTPMSFADSQTTINSMTSGQSIAYKGGDEFYGSLSISGVNGAAGNPITITSYGTGQAAIKGSEVVTGWNNDSGNIWSKLMTGKTVYQVIKDGDAALNSRFPNSADQFYPHSNFTRVSSVTSQTVFTLDGTGGDVIGGNLHMFVNPWTLQMRKIVDQTGNTVTIETAFGSTIGSQTQCFVNNAYDLLSQQDEWFFNETTDTLYVYSIDEPTGIEANTADIIGLTASFCSYINIDNIAIKHFFQDGIYYDQVQNYEFTNNSIEYCYEDGMFEHNGGGTALLDGNTVKGTNGMGLKIYHANAVITNNTLTKLGVHNNIANKEVQNTFGITAYGDDILIQNNHLTEIAYVGINTQSSGSLVTENFVKDHCLVQQDGGGYYTWNDQGGLGGELSTMSKNTVIGNQKADKDWHAHGFYMDGGSGNILLDNNTVAYCNIGISYENRNFTITNNNIYDCIVANIWSREDKTFIGGTEAYDNGIFSKDQFSVGLYTDVENGTDTAVGWDGWANYHDNNYFNSNGFAVVGIKATDVPVDNTDIGIKRMSLADWQTFSGVELNSTQNDDLLFPFTLNSYIGGNLAANPDLETDEDGWNSQNALYSRVSRAGQTGSWSMSVIGSTNFGRGYTYALNNVTIGSDLLIEFDLDTDAVNNYQLWIDDNEGNQYHKDTIDYKADWYRYKFPIYNATSTRINLNFYIRDTQDDVFIDEVSINAADIIEVVTDVLCYNETATAKDVALPTGTWDSLDGTQTNKVGTVNVPAYGSYIMIKQ